MGPIYGAQWRKWQRADGEDIDQLQQVITGLRTDAESRRHIVSAWNPGALDKMALPPCHCLFQFYVSEGRLSCHLYQRSADVFLGVPFNIASYAALTMMVAQLCDLAPGELAISFGDIHLYRNHFDQARQQLKRVPGRLPRLEIARRDTIDAYRFEDFALSDYTAEAHISAPIAV